jgi:hypothetical protein
LVVELNEGEHLLGELLLALERALAKQAAGEDREEDLDLVEPARCTGESRAPS